MDVLFFYARKDLLHRNGNRTIIDRVENG